MKEQIVSTGSLKASSIPACLIIMDGYGLSDASEGNAISLAQTPCLDRLFENYPWTTLAASGEAVGLPVGQMGNSEVGHLNIGAGRIVFQELTRINKACEEGLLSENESLKRAFNAASKPDAALHVMGLLSDGGVHSTCGHLYALLEAAKGAQVPQIILHCFMDGRDVSPTSGVRFLKELNEEIESLSCDSCTISIGSISGRYYAMDRDCRWDRVERAYGAIVKANPLSNKTATEIINLAYKEGITDEFIEPVALTARGVKDGDAVVFFNFRPDRAREITRTFVDREFEGFSREVFPHVCFVCLTEYDKTIPASVAFPKEFPEMVLADVLTQAGLTQYHIAETEKYAHVTFFFNGGLEQPKEGEKRVLIPSPKVATYDLQPRMSEPEVAATLVSAIDSDEADVYIVNFANPDMVGHTGIIPAAIEAVEAVDSGVSKVLEALEEKGGFALITADHGNADKMLEEDGSPFTAHTCAPVPMILVDYRNDSPGLSKRTGALCDIAPTLLELLGLQIPKEMTGRSLLVKP